MDALFSHGRAMSLTYFDRSPVKQGYVLLSDFQNLSEADMSSYLEECIVHSTSADK